jgi:hypothetical protein
VSGCSEPKNFPPDPERFLKERFGFGVVPDLLEKEPEVIQGVGSLGVLRTPSALCHFNRSFRNGNSLLIFFLFNQLLYLLIQCVWIIDSGQSRPQSRTNIQDGRQSLRRTRPGRNARTTNGLPLAFQPGMTRSASMTPTFCALEASFPKVFVIRVGPNRLIRFDLVPLHLRYKFSMLVRTLFVRFPLPPQRRKFRGVARSRLSLDF